jgi:DNA polymerase
MSNRQTDYNALVKKRKLCFLCEKHGMTNTSTLKYETNSIGKWSDWQGSLNSKILIVGQDWGTTKYWNDNFGNDDPKSKTNELLRELFLLIGYEIGTPLKPVSQKDLFFTNSVLCLKDGGMSDKLHSECYDNCRKNFLKELINILEPSYIISVGLEATNQVLLSSNKKKISTLKSVCGQQPIALENNIFLFPVYHCSPLGRISRNKEQQIGDWKKIAKHTSTKSIAQKQETKIEDNFFEEDLSEKEEPEIPLYDLKNIPKGKNNFGKVLKFAQNFSFKTFKITEDEASSILKRIENEFWENGKISTDVISNELIAGLKKLIASNKYSELKPPSHKDELLMECILNRLSDIWYEQKWSE